MSAEVIKVSVETVPSVLPFTGVIAARQAADISSQILAPVAELRVREGDRVAGGRCWSAFPPPASLQACNRPSHR